MTIRITTLSENTAGQPGLLAEWGLSILVEADGQLDMQHEFKFPPVTARQFRLTVDSTRAKLFNVHLFQLHQAR